MSHFFTSTYCFPGFPGPPVLVPLGGASAPPRGTSTSTCRASSASSTSGTSGTSGPSSIVALVVLVLLVLLVLLVTAVVK